MIVNSTKIRVRYCETDQMRYVHHSNYAKYFEIGRTELIKSTGMTYKEIEEQDIMLPVIELACNFNAPAFYDDLLTITTSLTKQPTAKIQFDYIIKNQNDKLICTGKTVLVFISAKTNKPMRCPKNIIEKLKIYK